MQTIQIQCVQLFCIFLLFDNIHCDNTRLNASQDGLLLNREVGCTAACMGRNVSAVCMYELDLK